MTYSIVIAQFTKMLQNLNKILDKANGYADSKKFEMDVLLNARLAPDQFNFIRQIQIATDTAKLGVSRLTGKDAPKHEDNEKTLADLKTRIDQVIQYLGTFKADDFKDIKSVKVTQPRWEGKYLHGDEYFVEHVIPNFYFHISTAYSILRHNGVDIGKKDYLGELPFKK